MVGSTYVYLVCIRPTPQGEFIFYLDAEYKETLSAGL